MKSTLQQAVISICLVLLSVIPSVVGLATPKSRVSIVTGSRGYLGREIAHEIIESAIVDCSIQNSDELICLVREQHVEEEQKYWDNIMKTRYDEGILPTSSTTDDAIRVKVMAYDMLDGGTTLTKAIQHAFSNNDKDDDTCQISCCIYHVASIFTPTDDHYNMALENVKGAEDLMNTVAKVAPLKNIRVVLTSSTAAVRGSNQKPSNGKYYTYQDWNTESELGKNWGNSYQYSKAASEKKAWKISKTHGVPMVSILPSFIFGPPSFRDASSSYSIIMVGSWVKGEAAVQSRLCVDVRDVAKAHVKAGTLQGAIGERLIVSTEARISSEKTAEALKSIANDTGLGDPDKIFPDTNFDGGAIPIGNKEVDSEERLKNILGITCRPVEETIRDMAKVLLEN
mmetsp:Transcript_31401/g.36646  ORF Transcript_31401/g.36646 Transcript_31401/m.36646 type:complete len:398 (+) Transcript_31401:172-1365(+)